MQKIILRSTEIYGCETLVMNKADAERLESLKRKILRKVFGRKNRKVCGKTMQR